MNCNPAKNITASADYRTLLVYDRILWDARLDRSAFAIGYIERMSIEGIRKKPFSEWSTDGDIPMHRSRYIRCGEEIVWDRDQHLDLFSAGLLPAATFLAYLEEETHGATNPLYKTKT